MKRGLSVSLCVAVLGLAGAAAASAAPLKVTWMPGFKAAGTPGRYNKVGVIKVGPAKARRCWSWSPEHRPRVTDDTRAVGNGIANPAQKVLNVHSTMGRRLPRSLLIYAFGTVLGKRAVLLDAQALAKQSGIPMRNLTLVDRENTYSHNDPAGAYPKNAFFSALIPFLRRAAAAS